MTPKQQRFIDEYLIDLNAAAAARRAGYAERFSDRIGYETLRKPEVAAAVAAEMDARARRVKVDADYVLTRLKKEADLTGEGASHSARVRALELLGKHLKMFTDKMEFAGSAKLLLIEKIVEDVDQVMVRTREEASELLARLPHPSAN